MKQYKNKQNWYIVASKPTEELPLFLYNCKIPAFKQIVKIIENVITASALGNLNRNIIQATNELIATPRFISSSQFYRRCEYNVGIKSKKTIQIEPLLKTVKIKLKCARKNYVPKTDSTLKHEHYKNAV